MQLGFSNTRVIESVSIGLKKNLDKKIFLSSLLKLSEAYIVTDAFKYAPSTQTLSSKEKNQDYPPAFYPQQRPGVAISSSSNI